MDAKKSYRGERIMGVRGILWVNPFLDEFYDWGKGKWWNTKKEFLAILDTALEPGTTVSNVSHEFPQEIINYLVEKVPEWYFDGLPKDSSGLVSLKLNHMAIGAFEASNGLAQFISAWENNTPFPLDEVNFFDKEYYDRRGSELWDESYKDYPEELKKDNCMLVSHEYYKTYVRLIELGGVWWNALLFTAEKNKSWCESSKISFLNWTQRNPMEVKD